MARVGTFIILCCALLSGGQAVGAGECLIDVKALAKAHAVAIDPPGGQAGDPPNATELGRSGGVVEPPPTHDPAALKPPTPFPSDMPTLPDITPSKPHATTGTPALRPADHAVLQSLLVTARTYARRGEEDACLRQLGNARDYLAQLPRLGSAR